MRWSSAMDATAPVSKSTEHDPEKWAPVFRIDHAQKIENFYRSITLSRVGAFSCANVRRRAASTFVAHRLRASRVLTPSTRGLVNRGLYRCLGPCRLGLPTGRDRRGGPACRHGERHPFFRHLSEEPNLRRVRARAYGNADQPAKKKSSQAYRDPHASPASQARTKACARPEPAVAARDRRNRAQAR